MGVYVVIYGILIILSLFDFSNKERRIAILYWAASLMILFIGLRGESGMDSGTYINFFNERTDTFWNWKGVERGYDEYGFYYLSVLIKSIFNNIDFYFFIISCLTLPLLVRSLKKFCLFPIFGFCIYFVRFLVLRDMNQIRQALAVLIVIYALKFLVNHNERKYVLYSLLAVVFHYSIIIILPFVLLYKRAVSFNKAFWILIFSGIAGCIIGVVLKQILLSTGLQVFFNYVNTENLGIANLMIYYQCMWCLLFFYFERRLASVQPGYYVFRNAYLYSTIILLLTSNLGVIGGRLSTIFATCEVIIIPALIYTIRPRLVGYLGLVVIISVFFYFNYLKMLEYVDAWSYF